MTKEEKDAMLLVAQTAERLMHENMCFKAMLKAFCLNPDRLPEWKDWLDRMMKDKTLEEPIREKFQHIYSQIELSVDPSEALRALLRDISISGKEN